MEVAVFYHVYQANRWVSLMMEQIGRMRATGLWDRADHLHVGINGTTRIRLDPAKVRFNDDLTSEGDTLQALRDYAHTTDAKILYLHTKGATRGDSPHVTDWRHMMEYFCVDRWLECLTRLDDADSLGCNVNNEPEPHYSGNFWWATSEYIRTLDDSYLSDRMKQELWIGTGGGLTELYDSGVNHYHEAYPEERYMMQAG